MKNFLIVSAGFLTGFTSYALAQTPGEVATSIFRQFGPDGDVWSAAVQRDGRILLGGVFTQIERRHSSGIPRLLPSGQVGLSLNPAYGVGGKAVTTQGMIIGPTQAGGYALITQCGMVSPAAIMVES